MTHPNSLKNLRPWVKGQSGCPQGRGNLKIPEELRAIKALTPGEVCRIVSKYARMTRQELELIRDDKSMPAMDAAIISIFQHSIKFGDFARLSFLLDRSIGKIQPIKEDDELDSEREELAKLSMKELLTLVKNTMPEGLE